VINGLSNLSKLTLRAIPKSKPLGFLTACEKLLDLTLIIGGRQSITDFSLPSLESLCITWVRGLEDLGPMSRFPRLKHLIVEDQLRLKKIDISKTDITNLRISNCKNLDDVQGLSDLKNLKSFLAFRTKLPLEGLLNLSWPESLEVLGLYSTSKSWNDDFEKLSAAKGYRNTPDS